MTYKIEMGGREDINEEDHPDISHIPNDQPIPEENPNKAPNPIPMNEPKGPNLPGPIEAPIKEPNKNPGIRVLNVEL